MRTSELFDVGIGHIVVTKRLPSNLLSCAFFLVDSHCLGIKDLHHLDMSPLDFAERFEDLQEAGSFIDLDPACARKILRGAVAFAARAGLQPARDYAVVEKIFGDVSDGDCSEEFVFGKDGKPFYVAGPRDTPARVRSVIATLDRHCAPGEWDYVVPLAAADDFLREADDLWFEEGPVIEHELKP